MVGFFDIPWEIRDQIWSYSVLSLKNAANPSDDLHMAFRRHGQTAAVSNPIPWQWLGTISGVSKAFAKEGRPYFFRSWQFCITEVRRNSASQDEFDGNYGVRFPGLQGFLQWAGDDARHLRRIWVTHPQRRQETQHANCDAVMTGLNSVGVERLGLGEGLSLRVEWDGGHLNELCGVPELVCTVDERGRFTVVSWKPKDKYSALWPPGFGSGPPNPGDEYR